MKILVCLFSFLLASSGLAMKLKKEEATTFQNCFKKAEKNCRNSEDKARCIQQETKKFDSACMKVYKKSSAQMGHMGSSCLDLFKLCPMKYGADDKEFKKFEGCIVKKLDKISPSCQKVMEQMLQANTGKKMSFKEMLKVMKKNPKKSSGENVQVKTK